MRPLSLAIEGFTAFRDREEIDFEPLDLFVITGPTGAGKTSILDAMVFALYGQVPRLGGKHGTSDLVSLGKVQARVLFEFSVAGKGRYRVARRLKRGAAQSATLERLEGEEWEPACDRGGVRECDRVLRELLGLDFDSFCKAVVLPQGEFHRFLKGDPAERRQVLVSLLGVSYFQRMGELARRRQSDLDSKVERTAELLAEQYGDATPEHLEELQAACVASAERYGALTASLARAEQHLKDAGVHRSRAEALGTQVSDLQQVAHELRDSIEACRAAELTRSGVAEALAAAAGVVDNSRQATASADASVVTLEAECGTLDQIAKAAGAAETRREAAVEEASAQAQLDDAERAEEAAKLAANEAEQREARAGSELAGAEAEELEGTTTWEAAKARLNEVEQVLGAARTSAQDLDGANDRVARARASAVETHPRVAQLQAALDEAIVKLEEHRCANAVAELADGLVPGDPCPVCGESLRTAVEVAPDVAQTLGAARQGERDARAAADTAAGAAATAEAELASAEEHQRTCEERLSEVLGEYDDVATLELEAATLGAEVTAAVEQLDERRALRKERQDQRDAAHDKTLKAQGEVARSEAVTTAARSALSDARERRSRALELLTEHFGGDVPDDAAGLVEDQKARLLAANEAARAARSELDRAAEAHELARRDAEVAERELAELDVALTRLRTRAETAARVASQLLPEEPLLREPPSPDGARDASVSELASWCDGAVQKVSAAHDVAEQACDAAERGVSDVTAGHDIQAPDAESAFALLKTAERAAGDDAAGARSAAQEAERRVSDRRTMEARIKDERDQISVLGALGNELRGDRFGEYIVLETLDLLAAHASAELLRISDGRYSLVPVEGDFQVVDHANADEQRSVKTLSGGETFLASLALALALSRHVGDLATEGLGAKLEAVFIDEGFGTLDPATLDEVIDALERLRADDLIVGVISHVPELAQRVRVGLEVQKQDGRSTIVASTGG